MSLPSGLSGRCMGSHRLALINVDQHQDGIVEEMIQRIYLRSQTVCPSFVRLETSSVIPAGCEVTSSSTISYLAISANNVELDNLISAAQDLSLEEGGGSLCVLGRSPFSKEKLSNQELRQVVRRQTIRGLTAWCNLLVAAGMAAVGLAINSSATVVASMLISPLMSPIIQLSFAMIDSVLRSESGFMTNAFRDFFVATLGCVCVGLLLCPAFVWAEVDRSWSWPTEEMESRTHVYRTLMPGTVISVISGIGVANSLRNRGINALVGVAISASLLPPLVNSGIYLAWGFLVVDPSVAQDRFYRGWISFLLTMINVLGVILSSALWFRLRGVGEATKHATRGPTLSRPSQEETESLSISLLET